MSRVYFADTTNELRLILAQDLIDQGQELIDNATSQEARREKNPRDRSLRTKGENAALLRAGRELRQRGLFLRDSSEVCPSAMNPFPKESRP